MELNKKQKEMLMDAHLLDKMVKDPDLIKAKLVDKQGRITLLGESEARKIAAVKHKSEWSN
jgi:arsenate reductase-like glutaredoxin family protein